MNAPDWAARPFLGLVEAAAIRGVSRSIAYELARKGLVETFKIGPRRYVYLDSLDTLGPRLSADARHRGGAK